MIVCYNVFNEIKVLPRSIKSISPYVDRIIVVDGAYRLYPHDKPYSTDGTVDYLRSLDKVELVETKKAWPSQAVKRTAYLDRLQEGEWGLVLDGDETLEELIKEPEEEPTELAHLTLWDNDFVLSPRFIKKIKGIRYITHYIIFNEDSELYANLSWTHKSFNRGHERDYIARIRCRKQPRNNTQKEFRFKQMIEEIKILKRWRGQGVTGI